MPIRETLKHRILQHVSDESSVFTPQGLPFCHQKSIKIHVFSRHIPGPHLICLAKMALKEYATTKHQLIPTISCCPMCDVERKWSQIVQQII